MLDKVTAYPRITDDEPIYNPEPECCACLTVVEQAEPEDREGYWKSDSWEVDLDAEEYRQVWTEHEYEIVISDGMVSDGSGTGMVSDGSGTGMVSDGSGTGAA